ncbi:GNAT family N-acetyltransferase [Persicirhabdus sediminis]|uniref:GNAT family N-acetyltransferase n=1 Tax=Persicirhabdus sediminis TaxID=454144 RepID=A0A8J7MF23_9BACT|nr:GNAT family N-acetyltransferase [Persicirhabdus sediminis]MBK1791542.1 GNAT family N-acetyltransferase [Persicirhabdus sediminis]
MIDMLVRLLELPASDELVKRVEDQGIIIRRARPYEKHIVANWAEENFAPKWKSEVEIACTRQPVTCYIATKDKKILGFACYDSTAKAYFGPTGVSESARGTGIGKALLFKCLEGLREQGYVYGIIGGVGPKEFYEKACGAIEIPGSDPGIYVDILPG